MEKGRKRKRALGLSHMQNLDLKCIKAEKGLCGRKPVGRWSKRE